MRNHFIFELAMGRCVKHPTIPFALADVQENPRFPSQDAHLRAQGDWGVHRQSRKRPSGLELSFQSRAAYVVRFILACGPYVRVGYHRRTSRAIIPPRNAPEPRIRWKLRDITGLRYQTPRLTRRAIEIQATGSRCYQITIRGRPTD